MGLHALAILIIAGGFADELYQRGDFQLAALEYSRILWEESDTLGNTHEALRLARCWQELGRYEESMWMYRYLVDGLPDGDQRAMASLGAGALYAELGRFTLSAGMYEDAALSARDTSLYLRGRLLGALLPMHSNEWEESSSRLYALAEDCHGMRRQLVEELAYRAASGEDLPYRSPFWCGAASALLPGSGQMICGRTTDGLIALGITAGAGTLFYLSLEEDNVSTSVLLGWLAFSFYGGNIYGGSRAAQYHNLTRRRELLEDINERLGEWPSD